MSRSKQGRSSSSRVETPLGLESLEQRVLMTWNHLAPAKIAMPRAAVVAFDADLVAAGRAKISNSEVDYYRFTAGVSGEYTFAASTPTSALDTVIGVFQKQGKKARRIASNDDFQSTDSQVTVNLQAGFTYVFGVTNDRRSPNGKYSWSVRGPERDDAFEDNDSFAQARSLGMLSNAASIGGLKLLDGEDWFSFTMAATGRTSDFVRIDFAHAAGDLDLQLYDAAGNLVDVSNGVGNGEQISLDGQAAGTYFLRVFGYNGEQNKSYGLTVDPATANWDDQLENNDTIDAALELGLLTQETTYNDLHMLDGHDWFTFSMGATGRSTDYVAIGFSHAAGDLDLILTNSAGQEIRRSEGVVDNEFISLDGLAAGRYYIHVYGYQGVQNPLYSLRIKPGVAETTPTPAPPPPTPLPPPPPTPPTPNAGMYNLYVNFDGANISRSALVRYAGDDWSSFVDQFDADRNGISVTRFLNNRGDREQIIAQAMAILQADLQPFGISVVRTTGLAVEGQRATTIFVGTSTLSNGFYHVACDIDIGNNNNTDIAFVGDEYWGNVNSTALAIADVLLHEAGHTYGLFHVQSGTARETMGLRYNVADQSQWAVDTGLLNQTYQIRPGHGPAGSQNSYRVMVNTFGLGTTASVAAAHLMSNPDAISSASLSALTLAGSGHEQLCCCPGCRVSATLATELAEIAADELARETASATALAGANPQNGATSLDPFAGNAAWASSDIPSAPPAEFDFAAREQAFDAEILAGFDSVDAFDRATDRLFATIDARDDRGDDLDADLAFGSFALDRALGRSAATISDPSRRV